MGPSGPRGGGGSSGESLHGMAITYFVRMYWGLASTSDEGADFRGLCVAVALAVECYCTGVPLKRTVACEQTRKLIPGWRPRYRQVETLRDR